MVYVISQSGRPLMPTERFERVRKLLKSGQAEIAGYDPFTIRLLHESEEYTQPLTLGIDTGSGHIGICVTDEEGRPVFAAELETRNKEVAENMKDRRMYRHARQRHGRKKRQRRALKNGTVFEDSVRTFDISGTDEPLVCKFVRPAKIRFQNRIRPDGWLTLPRQIICCRPTLISLKKYRSFFLLPVSGLNMRNSTLPG